MKKLIQIIILIAFAVGLRLYYKSSSQDELKDVLIKSCDANEECVTRIEEKYDACYEDSYKLGRRSTFDEDKFVSCMQN